MFIEGEELQRNYSLSTAANGREYRISVKREPEGRVSQHLHANVHEGDVIELYPPAGDFRLQPSNKPLVLISGGVSITPTLASDATRPVHFIHSARHGIGFDRSMLAQWLPADRDVDAYFLGPKSFMKAMTQHLKALGVPDVQCRYEFFEPASALE